MPLSYSKLKDDLNNFNPLSPKNRNGNLSNSPTPTVVSDFDASYQFDAEFNGENYSSTAKIESLNTRSLGFAPLTGEKKEQDSMYNDEQISSLSATSTITSGPITPTKAIKISMSRQNSTQAISDMLPV